MLPLLILPLLLLQLLLLPLLLLLLLLLQTIWCFQNSAASTSSATGKSPGVTVIFRYRHHDNFGHTPTRQLPGAPILCLAAEFFYMHYHDPSTDPFPKNAVTRHIADISRRTAHYNKSHREINGDVCFDKSDSHVVCGFCRHCLFALAVQDLLKPFYKDERLPHV